LRAILQNRSDVIGSAISDGTLHMEPTRGASKLSFHALLYTNAACNVHVYFDGDSAGQRAIQSAIDEKIIALSDYHLAQVMGRTETEFEDLLDQEILAPEIQKEFGVDVRLIPKSAKKLKWSDRAKECFKLQGKMFDSKIEAKLKDFVSRVVELNADKAINPNHEGSIEALVASLEQKLFDQ
jgi:hypothetical protein